MEQNLLYAFIWVSGTLVSNVLMDMMAVMTIAKVKPTLYGFFKTMFRLNQMPIPQTSRGFSMYFSIVGSWVSAFVAFMVIVILAIKKHRTSGEEQSK